MAINPFFAGDRPVAQEMQLRENSIIEAIQIYGTNLLYVPRDWVDIDSLLNEVTVSKFDKSYEIEGFVEGLEGLVRSAFIMDRLGLSSIPTGNIVVTMSKTRFQESVVDDELETPNRPGEGDLIFIPQTKTLLEIKESEPEGPLRSGGLLHVYRLNCELFGSSHELVNGDPETGGINTDGVPELLLDGQVTHDLVTKPNVDMVNSKPLGTEDAFLSEISDIIVEG